MHRPVPIIFGIGILAGTAIGFLSHSFSPSTAGVEIKFLFLASVFIVLVSLSLLILYAISMAWHQGGQYFIARYFGPEAPYFRSAFRRAILVAVLGLILFVLSRYGFLTQYFAGGAIIIIFVLEIIFSAHEKQGVD